MRYLGLLIVMVIIGRPALPVIDYVFNYEYIATELCVNRDRPEMHCNGKCYLMQAMAQEAAKEKQDKKGNLILRYELPVLYYSEYELALKPESFTECASDAEDRYLTSYQFLFHRLHLRPPIV
ncbi:MAG: hypothetical protein WA951_05840 [Leeuwenhoekiella sp.]